MNATDSLGAANEPPVVRQIDSIEARRRAATETATAAALAERRELNELVEAVAKGKSITELRSAAGYFFTCSQFWPWHWELQCSPRMVAKRLLTIANGGDPR